MANYLTTDTDLESVADAIRNKGGTTALLEFPQGFVDAISAISGGGVLGVTQDEDGYLVLSPVSSGGGDPIEVPSGYTQLKYVESSGTQAINTGVAPTLETKFQVIGYFLPGNGNYYPFGGCADPQISVGSVGNLGTNTCYNSFGDKTDKTIAMPFTPCETLPIYTVDKTSATVQWLINKSVALNATAMSGNENTRICLFGRGKDGNVERKSKCRIFRAKIWDNEVLLRDFVPALENATEEVGMYDIVNNVFYRNVGTGVFVGGEY